MVPYCGIRFSVVRAGHDILCHGPTEPTLIEAELESPRPFRYECHSRSLVGRISVLLGLCLKSLHASIRFQAKFRRLPLFGGAHRWTAGDRGDWLGDRLEDLLERLELEKDRRSGSLRGLSRLPP